MVRQSLLNDAAIIASRILTEHGIPHGAFGGWAIANLGGPRASKDVDLIVATDKTNLINMLHNQHGFRLIPQNRDDYVAFLWVKGRETVLVEFFTEAYQFRNPLSVAINGETAGSHNALILDVVYIYKGKLRAAATREKFTDSADLGFLENSFGDALRAHVPLLNLTYVGLALKR